MTYKEFKRNMGTFSLLLVPVGLIVIGGYLEARNNYKAAQDNHAALPEIVRPYDLNQDGVIDSREAQGLTNMVLRVGDALSRVDYRVASHF